MTVAEIVAATSDPALIAIRAKMSAALKREDFAEYHRFGAEHRRLLHAANPAIKTAWEQSR